MVAKNLPELDYFILEVCRKSLSSRGISLTHNQILDKVKNIYSLFSKFNDTNHSLAYLWSMYNSDPPYPPYNYFFETQNEALSFAKKVKDKYNINCEINLTNFRKWKLTSVKNESS
jgi:hypothetical protein